MERPKTGEDRTRASQAEGPDEQAGEGLEQAPLGAGVSPGAEPKQSTARGSPQPHDQPRPCKPDKGGIVH
jgi:hypothetical protein